MIESKNTKDALSYLNTGDNYANGTGVVQNHSLAYYYYMKALSIGCEEAGQRIEEEFDTEKKNLVVATSSYLENATPISPTILSFFRQIADKQRKKKNYGRFSALKEYFPLLYPDYDKEKAIADILADRDTADADIYYVTCCDHLGCEDELVTRERLLSQLYAPVMRDETVQKEIGERYTEEVLSVDEKELLQCVYNIKSSYEKICKKFHVEEHEIMSIDNLLSFPFIKPTLFPIIRRQVLKCILSIRHLDEDINKYLEHLDSDEMLLNICEKMKDQDMQLFFISFVELNIDIEAIEILFWGAHKNYKENDKEILTKRLNTFLAQIKEAGINHEIPDFTEDNLPNIEL